LKFDPNEGKVFKVSSSSISEDERSKDMKNHAMKGIIKKERSRLERSELIDPEEERVRNYEVSKKDEDQYSKNLTRILELVEVL
jgi:hypothetical protein